MSLLEKLKKNTTIKDTAILAKSKFFAAKDMIQTSIPVVNVAFSGDLDGGFTPGLTMWAGPSKHFKTAFSLLMAKAYQDKYPDSVVLFYDSEFGTPQNYFTSFGIDTDRVVHTPITDVEQLKFDIMQQLSNIERGERVMIVIDSIGNLASKKEVEDAMDGKSVADMSRAKQIKSLFRMVTPHLTEKARIPVTVRFDGGISKYSGLLDMALESGHVTKPNVGWYAKVNTATGEVESKKWRMADTESPEFWDSILSDETFKEWVRTNYQFSSAVAGNLINEVLDDGHE